MTFDEIFEAYYNLYRLEAVTPGSSDDEYVIALRLANEAISRWSRYDDTYWKELFTTNLTSDSGGESTVALNTTDYAGPSDMQEAGGYVRILDSTGRVLRRIAILEPQEAQFKGNLAAYCYFTGSPGVGFTLHLNPSPETGIIGGNIEYDYYRTPTLITGGSSVPDMDDPYFIVHRMLAQRFRGSRNPYYSSAKADAEDALKTMQLNNNSGNWANPWKLPDNSGSVWGW